MDARLVAAGAAAATTLAALGLVAAVLMSETDRLPAAGEAPVLIARTDPSPAPVDAPALVATQGHALDRPAAAEPPPVPFVAPAAPSVPAASRPVIAALPPVVSVAPRPGPPPPPPPPVVNHRYDGVLTVAEIGRIRAALKLSPDQEPYWPPIASILREVGRRQMGEIDAGQKPTFDLPGDLSSRLYSAVTPLLGTLRDDQKEEVRRRAKMLGLDSVASFI